MFNKRRLIALALASSFVAGSVVAAASAFAQGTAPIVGISTVTNYSVDGRITAIDPATRTVTLTLPSGATVNRKVSDAVQNLGIVKVGDQVFVGYEEKLSFVLSGPNARPPGDRDSSVVVGASGPKSAAGAAANQMVANWWVVGVDAGAGTLSLVNPAGGQVRTYNVVTPEGRAQLPRVKTGDYLTAVDSLILVVSITPKK
ncbi:MAG: hypothetical protein Q8N31_19155 [Reyranella sp.]|nr:hypothetical protein [Reyranella sp.]MDP3162135.1 hypothetical protein [Reyranella sp.]